MVTGYLGPDGSYSSLAAAKLCGDAPKKEYKTFRDLFSALEKGECDSIVIPIENSLNGAVIQNLDLFQSFEDVFAVAECVLPVDHRLVTMEGADIKKIKRIYSHQQALAQCGEYLAKNFPDAELVACPSTTAGLAMLTSPEEAGIVGKHFRADGYCLSEENIADGNVNLTHFLLIVRGGAPSGKSDKIFFSVTCKHETGALCNILSPIKDGGFNITKLEARPIKEKAGEYRFFIEVEGDCFEERAASMLENIKKRSNSFRLLGCY